MSENVSAKIRTNHVDDRYHSVREFIEDGSIESIFVKSTKNNKANIFTKNVNNEIYQEHVEAHVADRKVYEIEDSSKY